MADKVMIHRLYKELLRESSKFKSYYYRNYFTRKTKDQFRKHIEANEEVSPTLIKKGEEMLEMLRRQTTICNLYYGKRLVIETGKSDQ